MEKVVDYQVENILYVLGQPFNMTWTIYKDNVEHPFSTDQEVQMVIKIPSGRIILSLSNKGDSPLIIRAGASLNVSGFTLNEPGPLPYYFTIEGEGVVRKGDIITEQI